MGRRRSPLSARLRELDHRLQVAAATSGGVVTSTRCRELGLAKADLRVLLGHELWAPIRRGVYVDTRLPRDPFLVRCAALLAALSGDAVISHESAARLLRLPLPPSRSERVVLTRRPPAPSNDPLCGDVHVTHFDDEDVRLVGGVPVLAGARLVLDCCATMPPDSALAVADAMLHRGMIGLDDLRRGLRSRHARLGAPVARRVAARADGLAESWLESASRWWFLKARLPSPELQVRFGNGSRLARVDMLFDGRVVGEADGAGKYTEPGALYAEKQREDWLRDAFGLEVVRWVTGEILSARRRPLVIARLHRALDRATRRRC